jgi:hypothetical protein
VRELRSQLDEAETLVQSLRSDSAAERLKGKQIINDLEAELEQCLRDRETDKQVSARALENSDRSRAVEIEDLLQREQALTDENILLKNANEDLRVEFEQNMETRLEELAISFPEHKSTNENQIGELTNRLDQAFTEEREKWQIGKSQNAEWQSKMLYQLRDDTARYKSEADLSKPTASSKQQQAAALATTTLSEHKQMGLDTVAISIATEEESTPVGVIIEANDGAGSDQVCLDTPTTSSTAAAESRQVGLATVVKAADEPGKRPCVDTVATQDAADETCTPNCPQTTYKTKMEEYKDEEVNLKRQMQEMQVSSRTGLLDLEHSASRSKTQMRFTSSYPRHLSVTKRTRCS